jgi:hypothetical protein
MLAGLRRVEQATRGQEPLARAAALAFGLVYLHPMGDGNGRLHRFLISNTLQRDGAIPAGVIVPISATITSVRAFGLRRQRSGKITSQHNGVPQGTHDPESGAGRL